MKYFEAMKDKYGFSDGEAVPCGIEHYRAAYVIALNTLATRLNSCVRAYAWDRPGMHNSCLILFSSDAEIVADTQDHLAYGRDVPVFRDEKPDDPMFRAIDLAMDASIDSWVTCHVSLPKGAVNDMVRELSVVQVAPHV